jgi:hypothetical protein
MMDQNEKQITLL